MGCVNSADIALCGPSDSPPIRPDGSADKKPGALRVGVGPQREEPAALGRPHGSQSEPAYTVVAPPPPRVAARAPRWGLGTNGIKRWPDGRSFVHSKVMGGPCSSSKSVQLESALQEWILRDGVVCCGGALAMDTTPRHSDIPWKVGWRPHRDIELVTRWK